MPPEERREERGRKEGGREGVGLLGLGGASGPTRREAETNKRVRGNPEGTERAGRGHGGKDDILVSMGGVNIRESV